MNKFLITILLFVSLFLHSKAINKNTDAAIDLIHRVCNNSNLPVSVRKSVASNNTYFKYEVKDGRLLINGSDNVSICRGFYDYIKQNNMGMYSWSGNNISFPEKLVDSPSVNIVSPFKNHYYFNVCTYGYSMPYWDWNRWEYEIDWMALHGINMPLALVGYEAILYRVFKKFGLTDNEINNYFVGPAHLPWMRMGNVSGIDGPLNSDWHSSQIALQHKILNRMRSLDMKPICPGFPGFIPEAFKRLYPDLHIVETHWGGAFHNWMISPAEPLFSKISEAFIKEWEKEFGKCDYYLVDSFNEMDIPFPEKGNPARYEMAASYGEKVYNSIKRANKNAIWVMQGWMFGYQRYIWDYETLGALVSRVPDDKMLLLDLAVDYNKHFWHSEVNWEYYKGFYNKQWVYSVIPNMGGKTGMTGVLDFYANGHLEALSSSNKGNLVAHGLAPEGIENNEVLYELVTDAGWSNDSIDVKKWLLEYSRNRYGNFNEDISYYWDCMLNSVYGSFTDHPRFNWQFRPGSVKNGSINISNDYFKGLESFVCASDSLCESRYYLNDLCEITSQYLGGKAEILTKLIDQEYVLGDTLQAKFLQSRFECLMLGIDLLLSQHPTMRLDRWVNFASQNAKNKLQKKQYETNAKRIVTIWGPPVDDYAARMWSGLVGDYYLGRWKVYFNSRNSGKSVDLAEWERNWVEYDYRKTADSPKINIIEFAKLMFDISKDISADDIKIGGDNVIGTWNVRSIDEMVFEYNIPANKLDNLHSIVIESLKGSNEISLLEYSLEADGFILSSSDKEIKMINNKININADLFDNVRANNGCIFKVILKSHKGDSAGLVSVR